jgi:hypothetical protein
MDYGSTLQSIDKQGFFNLSTGCCRLSPVYPMHTVSLPTGHLSALTDRQPCSRRGNGKGNTFPGKQDFTGKQHNDIA